MVRLRAILANWRPSRGSAALVVYALVVAVAVAVVGLGGMLDGGDRANASASLSTSSTTVPVERDSPAVTRLAAPSGEIPKYDSPGGTQIGVAGKWYGYPMTMPILEQDGEWLKVMTPERPNMSTAWIRADQVDVTTTNYRIVIDLADTRVIVYRDGEVLYDMPAGLGTTRTPTPPGSYFVAVKEMPGDHPFGPVVLNLSAHSEAIESWRGMGDAIIAMHGPISATSDARIGTEGTYISNGCVRLHEVDQLKLAEIPLGTPVDII